MDTKISLEEEVVMQESTRIVEGTINSIELRIIIFFIDTLLLTVQIMERTFLVVIQLFIVRLVNLIMLYIRVST